LLPIRRAAFDANETREFAEYFQQLRSCVSEILVIDGSSPKIFEQQRAIWSDLCRHEHVDPGFDYLNDKVNGIHTGVQLATTDKIILGDDDVRYDADKIDIIFALLEKFEVVRPQNYLAPQPWWARMEAARMLINRATLRAADYPGTCAFRRETFLRAGHYDGDVLFDNEEIIRHFAREGASICYANDLFVRKKPPRFPKWLEQRPRQAYEDFGLRFKTALFFSLPLLAIFFSLLSAKQLSLFVMSILGMSILLAFAGRRRGRAREVIPIGVCFFAPLWIIERSLSTYWALYWFFARGGYPFGERLLTKGIGRDWIAGGKIASEIANK
jgi:hypothetical protein